MCRDCDWKQSSLDKRDFRHSKDGPEVIEGRPKSKRKSKRWCKGKEGREHRYEQVIWYTFNYKEADGTNRQEHRYRWACKGCGKVEWGNPVSNPPKHDHHFCETEIVDRSWRNYQMIQEVCCICKKTGRSYKFYE